MNKTELIEKLAERTGSSKDETQRRLEALVEVVAAALKGGEEVQIPPA
jgi:nucleoid DNA-binding protein